MEFNLDRMKSISRAIVEGIASQLSEKELTKSIKRLMNTEDLKNVIHQVREYGPQPDNIVKRKINAIDNEEVYDINPNLEYYPNLILTSIHLADYYTEK